VAALKRICVFCGSSRGSRPEYTDAARAMGRVVAGRGLGLVYGGGRAGLMGELADAALAAGGEVIGVIPKRMVDREVAHHQVTELRVVDTMHERKAQMYDLSDAFVALPGGLGTLEELFEVVTWTQLGLHAKPAGLLDVCGYFSALAEFLDHAVGERFIKEAHGRLLLVDDDGDRLLDRLADFEAPPLTSWLDEQTR
jgi:uncharacterized protein (TIGR00730 family)